jgi:hypothetical protein
MKTVTTILLLILLASTAAADYEPTRVYVIYLDGQYGIQEVSAAEFAIDNLPFDQCTITEHWNTNLIIGDLSGDIAMAFSPPLTGPLFILGYFECITWEPLANDHILRMVPTSEGNLLVVDGDYIQYDVMGGYHTFNCTGYDCDWCGNNYNIGLWADTDATICSQDVDVFTTPTDTSSFSALKALY